VNHFKSVQSNVVVFVVAMMLSAGVCSSAAAKSSGGYDAPYFQADFTEDLNDWTSSLVNPALLYRVNQMHVGLSLYRWSAFDDGLGFQNIRALFPVRRNHTLGFTAVYTSGIMKKTTTSDGAGSSDSGTIRFLDAWAIGHYSYRILPFLMVGANLKFRLQNQFGENIAVSHVPGLDIGVYYNPFDHYRLGDLGLSLTLQDVLPTQVKWKDAENPEVTISRVRAGVRYALFNDNLIFDYEFVLDNGLSPIFKNWKSYAEMFVSDGKGEIPVTYRNGFHVKYMFIPQIWLKIGWTNNNIPYLGFNYNLMYPLPDMINYVNFDFNGGYSFIETVLPGGDKRDERGFTGTFKLSTDFGQTREQKESKRLYDQLILAPMDAYNEAMRLYLAGKYWEASFAFGKVLSLFPNFHLNDKATWYMGNCYRFLYMNDIARQVYKDALEEFTTSEMRSKYIFGLQSIDYRENKYDDALKNHAFITNLYADSDIRPDADYLAGQIHFSRKNYNVAEQLFSAIQPGDPNYLYAQYTLAIINIENGKDQAALNQLKTIVSDTTQEVSDQLLQDAANTKLGHLYYEMGDKLRLAVESYQRVEEGSSYQDEALLGTAWAWIKVNQPNVSLQTSEKLISMFPESPLVPEALLLKGYALMLLKRQPEAVTVLEQCVAACSHTFVTDGDLTTRKSQFEQTTTDFAPTAEKIRRNALRKPTNKIIEERPSLENEFQSFAKESKAYFNYTLLAKSHTRFFKRKEEILLDAEYALARATKATNARKANQIIQNAKEKEDKIDEQIEKLKQELDQQN
jgi:TolA-binding protein